MLLANLKSIHGNTDTSPRTTHAGTPYSRYMIQRGDTSAARRAPLGCIVYERCMNVWTEIIRIRSPRLTKIEPPGTEHRGQSV